MRGFFSKERSSIFINLHLPPLGVAVSASTVLNILTARGVVEEVGVAPSVPNMRK